MTEEPSDVEINAYIDGQLDTDQCFRVEHYLSKNPAKAAEVMSDLSASNALRMMARSRETMPQPVPSPKPFWRRIAPMAAGLVGVLAFGTSLVLAHDQPPSYVSYAVESHRVAMLRAHMTSQIEAPILNMQEIAGKTQIAVPALPDDWLITDVQLFPSKSGPALMVAVRTQDNQHYSIFAIRERTDAPRRPDAIREGAQSVAYWRNGDMSYALTGDMDPAMIDKTAEALAQSWL